MGREELVGKYLEGQMSRRVFLRRLIGTGVATAAAIAYADVLEAAPAGASPADYYILVQDYSFSPQSAPLKLGQTVDFANYINAAPHSVTDASGMNSFDSDYFAYPAGFQNFGRPIAGTYPYHCKSTLHGPMTGTIRVPVRTKPASAPHGTTFTITWATSVPNHFVVDVQKKNPGGSFANWKHGVTTKSATFKPNAAGTYEFRSRMRRKSNGTHSGWSPAKSINVT